MPSTEMIICDKDLIERNDVSIDEPTLVSVEVSLAPPSISMTFISYDSVISYSIPRIWKTKWVRDED